MVGAAADAALGERCEPALDLVESGGQGRREVDVKPRMPGEPVLDQRGLVRAVVVHDQMHVEHCRRVGIDSAQELQQLAAAVAPMRLADDLSGRNVERREQRRRAVAFIVVGAPLGDARRQRQDGLRAVQRLDLALLIATQHHRHQRWIKIERHDVAHLLHEHRVGGRLEGFLAVRLQPERLPNARDHALREPRGTCHRARAPVRRADKKRLQRLGNQGADTGIVDSPGRTRARHVQQATEPLFDETTAPLTHHLLRDTLARAATTLMSMPSTHDNASSAKSRRSGFSLRSGLAGAPESWTGSIREQGTFLLLE